MTALKTHIGNILQAYYTVLFEIELLLIIYPLYFSHLELLRFWQNWIAHDIYLSFAYFFFLLFTKTAKTVSKKICDCFTASSNTLEYGPKAPC